MSIEQMQAPLVQVYPGANWPYNVEKMSDKQVAATYMRLLDAGKIHT